MHVSLIIAAGGSGKRFQNGLKKRSLGKLFLPLNGKPVLRHALEAFRGLPEIREIWLAVPAGAESWIRKNVLADYDGIPVRLIEGGKTRAESVLKALRRVPQTYEWVMVHDGARPFPPRDAIGQMLKQAEKSDGIVLGRPVVPTLKRILKEKGTVLETVDRTHLFEAETPQLVRRPLLEKAYRQNPRALEATDESFLIESIGGRMKTLAHPGWNIKITTPQDLQLAEAYCKSGEVSVGFGKDTHRLVSGRKFYLGGIVVPFDKGPLGHSDGDALLHAVSDAVLGAAAAGDIGDWFSDKDPKNKNIRSGKILEKVLGEARRRGWAPARLDSIVFLEKPRLGPLKEKIRKQLSALMKIGTDCVSIKAKTLEGLGPVGEGRAVTCEAIVLMRKSR